MNKSQKFSLHFFSPRFIFLVFISLFTFSAFANTSALVDEQWLEEQLSNPQVVILDIRSTQNYQKGHIPGSINAPYGVFGWRETVNSVIGMMPAVEKINQRIGTLDIKPENHVVVVADGLNSSDMGAGIRVYWTFKVLGHNQVSLLDGGFNAWKLFENDIASGAYSANANATPYPGKLQPQLLATSQQIADGLDDLSLIDARPDNQYEGYAKHPKAKFGGTIKGAERLPQHELFTKNIRFKSPAELQKVAQKYHLDLTSNKPKVAFCNTGHWAATSWFALSEILQLPNVKLYDGSWAEWSSAENLPVINVKNKLQVFWYNLTN